jgi:RNA polymerase sigma-70 factor (ECF subfamily)
MLEGLERGLALMSQLAEHAAMRNLFFAARADLLRRAGRHAEAIPDYEHALTLVRNEPERGFLTKRLAELRTRI